MRSRLPLLLLWSLAWTAFPAFAHPHTYVGGTSELNRMACDDPASGTPGLGGVCLAAGHIPKGDQGTSRLTVYDDHLQPVSATYCQDPDDDSNCGASGEHRAWFCEWLDLSPSNWDPDVNVYVFLDGPSYGNPPLSPCGSASFGVKGSVYHTP